MSSTIIASSSSSTIASAPLSTTTTSASSSATPSSSAAQNPETTNLNGTISDPNLVTTVSNVAEIFNAAGFAFKKLSELVQQLDHHQQNNQINDPNQLPSNHATYADVKDSHWDASDVEQFKSIMDNFNDGLNRLSEGLKNKVSERLKQEHTEKTMNSLPAGDRKILNQINQQQQQSSAPKP